MIQVPWSHGLTPPLPAWALPQITRFCSVQLNQSKAVSCSSFSPFPGFTYHNLHTSSRSKTKVPSKQFLYQEKGVQRFPDESCLLSKLMSNALFKRLLIPRQKKCTLEPILRALGHFHINSRCDTLTAGKAAVWKHRGTPLLHTLFLPLRNGRTTERQRLRWTSQVGLHLTPQVLSSPGFSRITPHQ